MKHILITIALVALPMLLSAQTENNHHKRDGKEHVKIEELVTDLTPTQRTRIEKLILINLNKLILIKFIFVCE